MSERDDAVGLFDQTSHVGWGDPLAVQDGEVILSRPTGDGATLSNVDRNGVFTGLAQQFPCWRHPDAFNPLEQVGPDELGRVTGQYHTDLVTDLDRAVDRQMQRD